MNCLKIYEHSLESSPMIRMSSFECCCLPSQIAIDFHKTLFSLNKFTKAIFTCFHREI